MRAEHSRSLTAPIWTSMPTTNSHLSTPLPSCSHHKWNIRNQVNLRGSVNAIMNEHTDRLVTRIQHGKKVRWMLDDEI
jgi:hypothetical protein